MCVWVSRLHYLDDLARLHGQSGEVAPAVDGHSLPEDRVQALHLIPRQHAEPPTLIRRTIARHGDVNFQSPPPRKKKKLEISWTNVTALYPLSDIISPAAVSCERVLSFTLKVGRVEKSFFFWWSQRCGDESGRGQPFPSVCADKIQSVWKEPIHKRV